MNLPIAKVTAFAALSVLMLFLLENAAAQFQGYWLDVGEYHNVYFESGARAEQEPGNPSGMHYPAILRNSDHGWARAFWVGVQDWTDEDGQPFDYYVSRIGARDPGEEFTSPVQTRIVSRVEDTDVYVDGTLSVDKPAVVDEVDPGIPADRMIVNEFNTDVGVTVTRTIYAYANQPRFSRSDTRS